MTDMPAVTDTPERRERRLGLLKEDSRLPSTARSA
jgi:hypothetical protein